MTNPAAENSNSNSVTRNSTTSDSSMSIYFRILRIAKNFWPLGLLALLGMILEAAAAGAFTLLIQPMIDRMFIDRDASVIAWLPWAIIIIFLARGLATFASDYGMASIGRSVVRELREQLMHQYLRLPSIFYDRESVPQMVSRLTYNTEQITQASAEAIKISFTDTLTIIALMSVMLWHSVKLTLAMFIIGPLIGLVVYYVGRRYRRINTRIQDSVGNMMQSASQALDAHAVVKIYGAQDSEASRFGQSADHNLKFNLKVSVTRALSSSVVQLLAAIALAIIIYMAGHEAVKEQLSAGSFMSLISAMMAMLPSLKRITNVQAMIQKGVAAASDIFIVLDMPSEIDNGNVAVTKSSGEIVFENVSLRYPNAEKNALSEINFVAKKGTMTAFVGRSGSGKTSIIKLLPRFYLPSYGQIFLDQKPLEYFRLADLRRQIGLVTQDVILFDDTIAANIAYGELQHASLGDIESAARAAHAWEFIEQFPQGLNTKLGEGGTQLSGGQRQRIALARAFLKDSPILILDEATSALDSESERLVQDALSTLMRGRTVFVVAHRLSTIEHADQVVVLDLGRIVEIGSHRELLSRDGAYAHLHRLQFREEIQNP